MTFVGSVTKFDEYRPNYRHVTPKFGRNGFCPARFLCHGNGSVCLAQENRKMIPKLIRASYVSARCQAAFHSEHSLHLCKRHPCVWLFEGNRPTGASRLQHDVTCVGWYTFTAMFFVYNPIELCWIAAVSKYFNIGFIAFRSLFIHHILRKLGRPCYDISASFQRKIYSLTSCCMFFLLFAEGLELSVAQFIYFILLSLECVDVRFKRFFLLIYWFVCGNWLQREQRNLKWSLDVFSPIYDAGKLSQQYIVLFQVLLIF
jgi:hypothetical protein